MGSGEFDFFSQLFGQAPLLPVCIVGLAVVYVSMMVVIFRRAAERRKNARKYRLGESPVRTKASFSRPEAPNLAAITGAAATMANSVAKNLPVPGSLLKRLKDDGVPEPDVATLLGKKPPEPSEPEVVAPSKPAAPNKTRLAGETAPPISTLPVPVNDTRLPAVRESDLAMTTRDNSTSNQLPEDAVEVLRLWRDLSDGSLLIQIGGNVYRHAAEIGTPDQHRRFAAIVRELSTMLNEAPRPPAVGATLPSLPPTPMALPQSATTEKPKGLFAKKAASEEPTGIADAIEAFLQARLLGSPEFAARSIHIRPTADHGVRIEVDGHFYDSIAEVIDPDVREYLENMMRAWEARH